MPASGGFTQPATRPPGHPAMPHPGAGWPGLWLRALRRAALQLSLLRQPALPQMPRPADRAMVAEAARPAAALSLLPGDFYPARRVARPGPLSTKDCLQPAAGRRRPQPAKTLRRPAVDGRSTQSNRRASHLDPCHALPSPRSFSGQRRRLVRGWADLAPRQKSRLPGPGPSLVQNLPRQNAGTDCAPPGCSTRSRPKSGSNPGSSTPSTPAAETKSWSIWDAMSSALPSASPAWSPCKTARSPFATVTTRVNKSNGCVCLRPSLSNASSNMSCPKAWPKSAITAWLPPLARSVRPPLGPCCPPPHPAPQRPRPARANRSQPRPRRPLQRAPPGFVRTVATADSFGSAPFGETAFGRAESSPHEAHRLAAPRHPAAPPPAFAGLRRTLAPFQEKPLFWACATLGLAPRAVASFLFASPQPPVGPLKRPPLQTKLQSVIPRRI